MIKNITYNINNNKMTIYQSDSYYSNFVKNEDNKKLKETNKIG